MVDEIHSNAISWLFILLQLLSLDYESCMHKYMQSVFH